MSNGASDGRDLAFRDRIIEYIGTSSSTIKSIQKEIKEIKDADRVEADEGSKRLSKVEEKLSSLKVEYTVTKAQIAIYSSVAGGLVFALIKVIDHIMKIVVATPK